MKMCVDEAGHDKPVAALDDPRVVNLAEIGADRRDAVVLDQKVPLERVVAMRTAHG